MIALSALESDCRLLGRQCIICSSSESRGRVAGWSLWRFMAPSWALIASFSLGSLGRPAESYDQCGAFGVKRVVGGGSYRWVWPKYRSLEPVTETNGVRETDDQERPRQKRRGDVWQLQRAGTLTWLSQGKKKKNYERSGWTADHLLLGSAVMKLWGERNIWSHRIHFIDDKSKARNNILVIFFFFSTQTQDRLLVSDYWKGHFLKRSLCWYRPTS